MHAKNDNPSSWKRMDAANIPPKGLAGHSLVIVIFNQGVHSAKLISRGALDKHTIN